jgi:hypothetical protein
MATQGNSPPAMWIQASNYDADGREYMQRYKRYSKQDSEIFFNDPAIRG